MQGFIAYAYQSFFLEFGMSFLEQLLGVRAEGDEKILDLNKQFGQEKLKSALDKFTIFPSKQRLAQQSKKYPQVGGGDTGDGKTYWVEHKDVDGSHVSWVKFNNKTNKLYVPSKPKSLKKRI